MINFTERYNKIKSAANSELANIEAKMITDIDIREPLKSYIVKFLTSPSKRIRPVLAILYTKALGGILTDEQLELLSAVELVHNASLIHDDIIDESTLRRGEKTISSEFDNKLGVISGDYLLAIAMEKIGKLNSIDILNNFSRTLRKMCIGEINQNFDRYKIGTIEDYIEKSKNKTGYLFETAVVSCLLLTPAAKNLKQAEEFALNIGIAFQIRDDLLNLTRNDPSKPANNDIAEGIYNAPVIYSGDAEDYTSGIEKTHALLDNYLKEAENHLTQLPKNEYTTALREFLELLKNV